MKRKRFPTKTVFFLLLAGAAATAYVMLPKQSDVRGEGLLTQPVTTGSIQETVTAVGTLNPVQIITVGTQVTGQVNKLYVQANQSVEKDEIMAEIDPSLVKAQLQQSEAALQTAQDSFTLSARNLERIRRLAKEDYVSKSELERAELEFKTSRSNVDAAKARVDSDRANMNYTTIRAPVAGVVISQEITEGQTVSASLQAPTLFKIAQDLSKMKIEIALSEADIGRVKEGQTVNFTVDAFPERQFDGLITKVLLNPNTSQSIVTYTVMVEVNNPEKILFPGMTAYVSIVVAQRDKILRVPNAAFRFAPEREKSSPLQSLLATRNDVTEADQPQTTLPNGRIVYVVREGKLLPLEVATGITDGKMTEVADGNIKDGEKVAVGYEFRDE